LLAGDVGVASGRVRGGCLFLGGDGVSNSATAEGGSGDGECKVGDIVVRVQGKGGSGGAERGVGDTTAVVSRTTVVCYTFHRDYQSRW